MRAVSFCRWCVIFKPKQIVCDTHTRARTHYIIVMYEIWSVNSFLLGFIEFFAIWLLFHRSHVITVRMVRKKFTKNITIATEMANYLYFCDWIQKQWSFCRILQWFWLSHSAHSSNDIDAKIVQILSSFTHERTRRIHNWSGNIECVDMFGLGENWWLSLRKKKRM